jgi:cytochrome P450
VQSIIDRRDEVGGDDVLATFVEARREHPGEVTDRQLRDEILTLYLAGHDATSHTLTWMLHFTARHPEIQERMRDEARRAMAASVATPDLRLLPYTRSVVEETLRIMPAAAILARQVVEDDAIDGVRLPAGSWVVLSPFITHHLSEFWPDPDRFDPERFTPDRARDRHPFAYCPFGLGPRTCIGNHLAMAELVTIAAMLLVRYELAHPPGTEVTPIWRATLQPKGGLTLTRRRIARE